MPFPSRALAARVLVATLGIGLAPGTARAALPLTRARLYETGVGYFERSGRVEKGASLPIPAGQLDDALKTLVVLSGDKSVVAGVGFDSRVSRSMGRALAGLGGDGEARLSYTDLLRSLKGADVVVKAGSVTHQGRLMDVTTPADGEDTECVPVTVPPTTERPGCQIQRFADALLLTDHNAMLRLRVDRIDSIAPRDRALGDRFQAALDAMSPRGAQTEQALSVLASAGTDITLGYVAETPVWRSTYRLLLDNDDHGTLQGWALVHNDTDQDWKRVQIELVNGQPDSFLYPLAAPRYAPRELLTPPRDLSTVPQLLDTTVDNLWLDGEGGLGLSGIGTGGGGTGQGFGAGQGRLGGSHRSGVESSSLLRMGDLAATASATGVEAEALFLYKLSAKTDLGARSSALLPFVTEQVSATQIAWLDRGGAQARSALRLENDTQQTLPAGTVSVFWAGGFAGETLLDRLKPKESTILEYGLDLDVQADLETKSTRQIPKLVRYGDRGLEEHDVRERDLGVSLSNKSGAPRRVYLALDAITNARIEGADEVGFDAGRRRPYAVFQLAPGQELKRSLRLSEGIVQVHGELSPALLRQLSGAAALAPKVRTSLSQAAASLERAETQEDTGRQWRASLKLIESNLLRLRGHVATLKGTESAEKIGRRILAREAQVESLQRRIGRLDLEAKQSREHAQALLKAL